LALRLGGIEVLLDALPSTLAAGTAVGHALQSILTVSSGRGGSARNVLRMALLLQTVVGIIPCASIEVQIEISLTYRTLFGGGVSLAVLGTPRVELTPALDN